MPSLLPASFCHWGTCPSESRCDLCHIPPITFHLWLCSRLPPQLGVFWLLLDPRFVLEFLPASDQSRVEWRGNAEERKNETTLVFGNGIGVVTSPATHTVRISQSINMIHGGYMVLYCQLCNLVVCQLNRCLSSLVCFCEQWFGRASLKSRPGLGTHASVSWRECGICSSETRI